MRSVGVRGWQKEFVPSSGASSGTGADVVLRPQRPSRVVGILTEPSSSTLQGPEVAYPSDDQTEAGSLALSEDTVQMPALLEVDPYVSIRAVGNVWFREADPRQQPMRESRRARTLRTGSPG